MTEEKFATLTGSAGPVKGVIKHITTPGVKNTYRFISVDDTLHLTIAPDEEGSWQRIDSTEPYFSGWVDEMAEQIPKLASPQPLSKGEGL